MKSKPTKQKTPVTLYLYIKDNNKWFCVCRCCFTYIKNGAKLRGYNIRYDSAQMERYVMCVVFRYAASTRVARYLVRYNIGGHNTPTTEA